MTDSQQGIIALEEAVAALIRMIERGVKRQHIPGSALFLVGIGLMVSCVSRKAIGIWLEELAARYNAPLH